VLNVQRVALFLAGFTVGFAVNMLLLSEFTAQIATGYPLFFMAGLAAAMFASGMLLGRKIAPKSQEMRLTGRVFDFPQGSVMVEVALRRMRSILPTKVTQE